MIDFKQTCKMHGMSSDEMKAWLETYPKSNKKVVMVCDVCGDERTRNYTSYKPICRSCGKKVYWSDPDVRARYAQTMRVHYDDPAYRDIQSRKKIEYWSDPVNRLTQSLRIQNSSSSKEANVCMVCGNDLVGHHTLYDHSDLSKNVVMMTRPNHTMGHRVLRELGIEIPHINTEE